jgi:hypothetical protein
MLAMSRFIKAVTLCILMAMAAESAESTYYYAPFPENEEVYSVSIKIDSAGAVLEVGVIRWKVPLKSGEWVSSSYKSKDPDEYDFFNIIWDEKKNGESVMKKTKCKIFKGDTYEIELISSVSSKRIKLQQLPNGAVVIDRKTTKDK